MVTSRPSWRFPDGVLLGRSGIRRRGIRGARGRRRRSPRGAAGARTTGRCHVTALGSDRVAPPAPGASGTPGGPAAVRPYAGPPRRLGAARAAPTASTPIARTAPLCPGCGLGRGTCRSADLPAYARGGGARGSGDGGLGRSHPIRTRGCPFRSSRLTGCRMKRSMKRRAPTGRVAAGIGRRGVLAGPRGAVRARGPRRRARRAMPVTCGNASGGNADDAGRGGSCPLRYREAPRKPTREGLKMNCRGIMDRRKRRVFTYGTVGNGVPSARCPCAGAARTIGEAVPRPVTVAGRCERKGKWGLLQGGEDSL